MAEASKAQRVREYMVKHPDATPQEVSKALTAQGTAIGARYVSDIKTRGHAVNAKRTKPRVPSKKKTAKKTAVRTAGRRGRSPRPYPAKTLEETLVIPRAIREQNNGNPWDTEDVAQASLDVARSNNKFFYTAAAARDYGLTVGTEGHRQDRTCALRARNIFCR